VRTCDDALGSRGFAQDRAQALLGHTDLETTLNTYMHALPVSLRSAVDRVAGVLFSDVLKLEPDSNESGTVN
jgi:integrase